MIFAVIGDAFVAFLVVMSILALIILSGIADSASCIEAKLGRIEDELGRIEKALEKHDE